MATPSLLRHSVFFFFPSDSSFSYEEEVSGALGRGYRCGFLGMLHLEIISERLRREFNLELIVTLPSTTYEVTVRGGKELTVYSPHLFPEDGNILSALKSKSFLHNSLRNSCSLKRYCS